MAVNSTALNSSDNKTMGEARRKFRPLFFLTELRFGNDSNGFAAVVHNKTCSRARSSCSGTRVRTMSWLPFAGEWAIGAPLLCWRMKSISRTWL